MSPNELLLGDVAPEIKVRAFVKGEPVASFLAGRVYVVELWATWCGPCLQAISHLTELQAKYPDVSFIGVAVTETDLDALTEFVKEKGDEIGYTIAADIPPAEDENLGWMHRNWGEAAYQSGIPSSYVVDRSGRIAWIGHPAILEPALHAVVDGTYDLDEEARKYSTKLAMDRVRESKHLEKVVSEKQSAADLTGALQALDEAFEAFPDMEASKWGQRKLELLFSTNHDAALGYGQYLFDTVAVDNGQMLASLGDIIAVATTDPDTKPDPSVASALATLAVGMLLRAEKLIGKNGHPHGLMRLSQSLAHVLLEIGLPEEALQRALKAREWAVLAGGDDAYLARFDHLARRCEAALC